MNLSPEIFYLLNGLFLGGVYALLGAGISLTYRAYGFVSLGQAAQITVAAYAAWLLANDFGIGFWPALVIVPLVVGVVFRILDAVLIGSLADGTDLTVPSLTTFGLSLAVIAAATVFFGLDYESYAPVAGPTLLLGLPAFRVEAVLLAIGVCWLVWIGTRPVGGNDGAAQSPGATSAVAAALAAFAAVLNLPMTGLGPQFGWWLALNGLALAIAAGPASTGRVMLVGFIAGILQGYAQNYGSGGDFVPLALAVVLMVVGPRPAMREAASQAPVRSYRWLAIILVGLLADFAYSIISAGFEAAGIRSVRFTLLSMVAAAVALLFRRTGQFSLAHGTLYALAGWATAEAALYGGAPTELALLAAILTGVLGGLLIMLAMSRYPAHFAPAVTLALAGLAGRIPLPDDGISLANLPPLFGTLDFSDPRAPAMLSVLGFVVFVVVMLRSFAVSEDRATWRRSIVPVVLAGAAAGLAGGLEALINQFVSPPDPITAATTSLPAVLGAPTLFEGPASMFAVLLGSGAMAWAEDAAVQAFPTAYYQLGLGIAFILLARLAMRPAAAPVTRHAPPSALPIRFNG